MNLEFYGVAIAGATFFYWVIRNFKKDIEHRFDRVDSRFDRVDGEFSKIRQDLTEIKERLSFLEAANIYTMPSEPSPPNNRSLAAIKMHQRRRQKAEKKDG